MFSRIAIAFVVMGLFLWLLFSYPLFLDMKHYISYTEKAPLNSVNWSVRPINDELWRPVARFSYTVNDRSYQKEEMFMGGRYRNPYAANSAVDQLKEEYTMAWYNPSHPEMSTLEKFFPLKRLAYAFMTLGLLLYGVWFFTHLTNRVLK